LRQDADRESGCELVVKARRREDLVAFLHVGKAVVEKGEDGRGNFFAEPVAGTEILVDPDLHRCPHLFVLAVEREMKPYEEFITVESAKSNTV
jgi:hypothetical protein